MILLPPSAGNRPGGWGISAMREATGNRRRRVLALMVLCGFAFLAGAMPASAQKDNNKKKKKDDSSQAPIAPPAASDEEQINTLISEMLGAWQVGDIDRLHKTYADDVSVVNGAWAPPVTGWVNFLPEYQKQRARMRQVRLDRENTLVRVNGNFAWACYQWDFSGVVDGQQMDARGQASLVLERRVGRWLIVHNHTSVLQQATQPVQAQAPPPAKP
jgi:ketosteroid isomerase-like protein